MYLHHIINKEYIITRNIAFYMQENIFCDEGPHLTRLANIDGSMSDDHQNLDLKWSQILTCLKSRTLHLEEKNWALKMR